jgi:hypothetical protein
MITPMRRNLVLRPGAESPCEDLDLFLAEQRRWHGCDQLQWLGAWLAQDGEVPFIR